MQVLLTTLDADRRRETDTVSHKFVGTVERLFAQLPKPMAWREAAINWIIDNELGRRNLTPEQRSYLRGKRYNREKHSHGGDRRSSGENHQTNDTTAETLAKEYGVGERTIRDDAEFAEAVDALEDQVRQDIRRTVLKRKSRDDKAEALRVYTRQAGESLEMQNWCAEIKLRAERRVGELLADMDEREERHPGGNIEFHGETQKPTLADIGLDKAQSHRYQVIARLPEEMFEAHIAETKAAGQELTSAGMVPQGQWRFSADLFSKHIEDHGEVIHAWVALRGEHPVQAFARRLHVSCQTFKPNRPMDQITQEQAGDRGLTLHERRSSFLEQHGGKGAILSDALDDRVS